VVGVCVAFNVISLIAILTAPETLGIDMNRTDPAAKLSGTAGFAEAGLTKPH